MLRLSYIDSLKIEYFVFCTQSHGFSGEIYVFHLYLVAIMLFYNVIVDYTRLISCCKPCNLDQVTCKATLYYTIFNGSPKRNYR